MIIKLLDYIFYNKFDKPIAITHLITLKCVLIITTYINIDNDI